MIKLTCIKALKPFFLPNGTKRMREMRILAVIILVTRSSLHVELNSTSTLSRLLAISSGLQKVTEMNPPSSPAIKLTIFSLLMMCRCSDIRQYISQLTLLSVII